MDWQLKANQNGHIACTHGGECLAGLATAIDQKFVTDRETAVVDSTAHALKFAGFQDHYFSGNMPEEFNVVPDPKLMNAPIFMHPKGLNEVPAPGKPLKGKAFDRYVQMVTQAIADNLNLKPNIAS